MHACIHACMYVCMHAYMHTKVCPFDPNVAPVELTGAPRSHWDPGLFDKGRAHSGSMWPHWNSSGPLGSYWSLGGLPTLGDPCGPNDAPWQARENFGTMDWLLILPRQLDFPPWGTHGPQWGPLGYWGKFREAGLLNRLSW